MPTPISILIVDDHPVFRTILKNILKIHNFEIMEASNGIEAITLFDTYPFDLVVTDMNMPISGGLELNKYIKSTTKKPPVILCTSDPQNVPSLSKEFAFAAIFTKPCDFDEITHKIFKILDL